MTVSEVWRVLAPGIEIQVISGGVELANDLPFYFNSDLLDREVQTIKSVKKNKIIIEVY